MLFVTSHNPGRPKRILKEGQRIQQEVAKLGPQVQALDNMPGVDSNPELGKIEFTGQAFESNITSGNFSGQATIVDGHLERFTLRQPDQHSDIGLSSRNGRVQSWAPVEGGYMTVVKSPDGKTSITDSTWIDPNTPKEKLRHKLKNVKDIAVTATLAAIPVIGLFNTALTNMFNDTNQGHQVTSIAANVVGTAALAFAVGSPIGLGLAGASLLTAGLSAGVQAAKEAPGNFTKPYFQGETYNYPVDKA